MESRRTTRTLQYGIATLYGRISKGPVLPFGQITVFLLFLLLKSRESCLFYNVATCIGQKLREVARFH